jgi:multidrug efflux pump subunit AcrB
VRDGNPPQTNIVHVDGNRSVLMMVLKNGSASTLDIIAGIKQKVADDQGFAADNAQDRRRSATSRCSCARAIRAWPRRRDRGGADQPDDPAVPRQLALDRHHRDSIPLAMLGAIIALSAIGETLNIMTLGGLALAVGILVDDATVTIENINWHLEQGKDVETAIMDGAARS